MPVAWTALGYFHALTTPMSFATAHSRGLHELLPVRFGLNSTRERFDHTDPDRKSLISAQFTVLVTQQINNGKTDDR